MALLLRAPLELRAACDVRGVAKPALQLQPALRSTGTALLVRWGNGAYRERLTLHYASEPLLHGASWRLKRRSRRGKVHRRGHDRER